jgi:rhodanese-related sulfurtransferase/cytochrome c biogenesis protein CcdA
MKEALKNKGLLLNIATFLILGSVIFFIIFLVKREITQKTVDKNDLITAEELKKKIDSNDFFYLIDARSKADYEAAHIPSAINIPLSEIEEKSIELLKQNEVVIYCEGYGCSSSFMAKNILLKKGFDDIRIYNGGLPEWESKGFSTEKGEQGNFLRKSRFASLPLVLGAGLADGFNPCAIGMLLFLLGYLIIFAEKPEKSFQLGLAYILTTYIAYFLLGLVLLNSLRAVATSESFALISSIMSYAIIFLLVIAAAINIKDYFFMGKGVSLQIPHAVRGKLAFFVEKATLPSTIILAFLVTFFESPCSLPLYVGTLKILKELYNPTQTLVYLGLYNLMFVMPLIVLFTVIIRGEKMVAVKEWEHQNKPLMKLTMGISQLVIAIILFLI